MSNVLRQVMPAALPPAEPTLVMVGSTDDAQAQVLDRLLVRSARVIDLRSNAMWTEVEDGRAFLKQVLREIPAGRANVRFGFAPTAANVSELLNRALLSSDLQELSLQLEAAEQLDAPVHSVRYQPIVSLKDRSIIGFESLIRATQTSTVGQVKRDLSAGTLIDQATAGGWIGELDVLGRSLALSSVGPWLGKGLLFLNVMAPNGDFDSAAIRDTIDQAGTLGLEPDQVVLEAVEHNRYRSLEDAAKQIEEFRSLGVRIAVDDVGDGYASLRTIVAFKPDIVKIAGSMAKELGTSEGNAVVKAIVQLAHDSGSWVIAENIETLHQAEQAAALGVDWGQGHYFGAPGLP